MTQHTSKSYGTTFAVITFLLAAVLLYLYVENYFSTGYNPNQQLSVASDEPIRLQVSRDGHYRVSGLINNEPVLFMLDTGATDIALSERLANHLGLKKGARVEGMTANGVVQGWLTKLDSITIGGVTLKDMNATILPNMDDEILLGMSYLRYFDWQHSQGELVLTPVKIP